MPRGRAQKKEGTGTTGAAIRNNNHRSESASVRRSNSEVENKSENKSEPYLVELPLEVLDCLKVENGNGRILVLTFPLHDNLSPPVMTSFEDFPRSRAFMDVGIYPLDVVKVSFHARKKPEAVRQVLSGLSLSGKNFRYFGCSNSQLKSRNAYLISRTFEEIDTLIAQMGNFSRIQSAPKLAKRIGMLFSECNFVFELDSAKTETIDDISRGTNLLTDGCGYFSKDFRKKIVEVSPFHFHEGTKYKPSVIQIRYRGFKGVLSYKPSLKTCQVQFRSSMKKFEEGKNLLFGVVDASKPYSFASLNAEIVTLLFAAGISRETMENKLRGFLQFLRDALQNAQKALELLAYHGEIEAVKRLTSEDLNAVFPAVRNAVLKELGKTLNDRKEHRIYILVPKSRLLFGVAEPESRLAPDEIFARVTLDGFPKTIIGNVMVTRNPCLHRGDVRVFKAVDHQEYHHLVDCILFSTHRDLTRSQAADLAGGDLDGDKFCVIFDQELIPNRMFPPGKYVAAKQSTSPPESLGRNALIDHFARYTYRNSQIGYLKRLYLKWVENRGAACEEAQKLSDLFSSCVDGEAVKVPLELSNISHLTRDPNTFIVNILTESIKEHVAAQLDEVAGHDSRFGTSDIMLPRELLSAIVYDQTLLPQTISQFQLFQMIYQAQQSNVVSAEECFDMILCIDYAVLSQDEKLQAYRLRPELERIPFNALTQSEVLSHDAVERFDLLPRSWKRLYSSSILGPALDFRLFDCMYKFTRKLILLRASDHLTLGFFFQQEFSPGINPLVHATYIFATDHHDYFQVHALTPGSFELELDETENRLQIYRGQRGNSYFWMKCVEESLTDGCVVRCRVSIDLANLRKTGFRWDGLIKKNEVTNVELYVISSLEFVEIRHHHSGHSGPITNVI